MDAVLGQIQKFVMPRVPSTAGQNWEPLTQENNHVSRHCGVMWVLGGSKDWCLEASSGAIADLLQIVYDVFELALCVSEVAGEKLSSFVKFPPSACRTVLPLKYPFGPL